MNSEACRERGFTLVEILISLTIMTILIAALFSGFDTAQRAWNEGAESHDTESALRLAFDELSAGLRSASSSRIMIEMRPAPYFFGSPDTLRFLTYDPSPIGGELTPGLVEVTWRVDRDESTEEQGLIVERALPDPLQPVDDRISEIVEVAPEVARLKLRYFHYPPLPENEEEALKGIWAEIWDPKDEDPRTQPQNLPEGVEVTLGFVHPTTNDTVDLPPMYARIYAKTQLVRSARSADGGSFEPFGEFR